MHAASKFRGKRLIDHAMAIDAALAFERVRHDIDAEMRFPAFPMSGMSRVLMRLIFYTQGRRRKSIRQFVDDNVVHGHMVDIRVLASRVNNHIFC